MKIKIQEVKQAMRDAKFRKSLPPELKADVQKYEQNPDCACNLSVYNNVLRKAGKQLLEYFPGQEVEVDDLVVKNNFLVINCHVEELENKLKELPHGRKQIAVARFQDQITVIVNELDL